MIYDFKQKAKGRSFGVAIQITHTTNAEFVQLLFVFDGFAPSQCQTKFSLIHIGMMRMMVHIDVMWPMRKMPMAKINLNSLCDCVSGRHSGHGALLFIAFYFAQFYLRQCKLHYRFTIIIVILAIEI